MDNSVFTPEQVLEKIMQAAVLISTAAKDAVGKLMGVFFPIMAFVVAGWEHSVANMFYLPAGIFAAHHSAYVQKAQERYGLTTQQIQQHVNLSGFFGNILPVTLGNIVGAMICMALPLYLARKGRP